MSNDQSRTPARTRVARTQVQEDHGGLWRASPQALFGRESGHGPRADCVRLGGSTSPFHQGPRQVEVRGNRRAQTSVRHLHKHARIVLLVQVTAAIGPRLSARSAVSISAVWLLIQSAAPGESRSRRVPEIAATVEISCWSRRPITPSATAQGSPCQDTLETVNATSEGPAVRSRRRKSDVSASGSVASDISTTAFAISPQVSSGFPARSDRLLLEQPLDRLLKGADPLRADPHGALRAGKSCGA